MSKIVHKKVPFGIASREFQRLTAIDLSDRELVHPMARFLRGDSGRSDDINFSPKVQQTIQIGQNEAEPIRLVAVVREGRLGDGLLRSPRGLLAIGGLVGGLVDNRLA